MAKDYAQRIPSDKDGKPMQGLPPPMVSLARSVGENRATSSAIGLSPGTSVVEVTAVGNFPAGIKWGASIVGASLAVATADFDNIVPPNSTRLFVVPQRVQGVSSISSYRVENGLYSHMAVISGGIGSVLTAEF